MQLSPAGLKPFQEGGVFCQPLKADPLLVGLKSAAKAPISFRLFHATAYQKAAVPATETGGNVDRDKPRILFLDIETKPAIVYTFGLRDQNIGIHQVKESGSTICVGLKWLGERKVHVFSDWEHGHQAMIERVHALVSCAEAVGTYNGVRFDMPKLMGEFMLAGLPPPPPLTQIDAFQAVRKMGFLSSKLAYIAPLLGLGNKLKHEGLDMWIKVMAGDPAAQKRMARYCAQDVRLLEDLYVRIMPYIANHPHMGNTGSNACGSCGSSAMQSRGTRRTKASHIQRLQCQKCGSWQSGTRRKAAA